MAEGSSWNPQTENASEQSRAEQGRAARAAARARHINVTNESLRAREEEASSYTQTHTGFHVLWGLTFKASIQ